MKKENDGEALDDAVDALDKLRALLDEALKAGDIETAHKLIDAIYQTVAEADPHDGKNSRKVRERSDWWGS